MVTVGIKKMNGNLDPKEPRHLKDFVTYKDYGKLRASLNCNMAQVHPRTAEELIRHYRKKGKMNSGHSLL
ncbi:hypothetical protein AKJ45_01335 [candidate division MSBL1 archaeon SCGC-AAA261F19]|uniref:Uncharacterized protein n=1 Tax=candidate division MSBL1 archaeon SCGC-AAA261F19 TaxID=1698275 RepID=A0A133VAU1_9EURY|nr:hypothetical protein AKJ45_01335 [candidate division MSBL1 archaeon SCGC-AAA261F19]